MEFSRDERFLAERREFRLRHTCEFCQFFDAVTGNCVHGWPNEQHREKYYRSEEHRDDPVVFCKEFDLATSPTIQ